MGKKIRGAIYSIIAIISIFLVGMFVVNNWIKNKVENFIAERLPETITQSYEDLSLNTFEGTITFTNVSVAIKSKRNDSIHTQVKVPTFIIEDVSYWDYLFSNKIHIEDIKLFKPEITYYKQYFSTSKDTSFIPIIKIYKPILIDELSIDNVHFTILDETMNSTLVYAENLTIEVDDILITSETLSKRLPVTFGDYNAKADSIFVKLNPYENFSANKFFLKDRNATIEDLTIQTKYSKFGLSKIITKERDHFEIKCPKISITGIDFGFNERRFFYESTSIKLQSPSAFIFRDKLVADDTSIKPLYSAMLRELPFDLMVSKATVENGELTYQERIKADNSGGSVVFKNMDVNLQNISNTYSAPIKTTIEAKSTFMVNTPFAMNWSFDVNDINDSFIVKSDVGQLSAKDLNPFLEPNLGIRLSGQLNKTYMTTSGDKNSSYSDMKINYDDFKISILDKDGKEKNKLLSAIANILISKNSKKDNDNYREASVTVTPDRTKSFFNYAWLNIKDGLIKSMTGRNKENK